MIRSKHLYLAAANAIKSEQIDIKVLHDEKTTKNITPIVLSKELTMRMSKPMDLTICKNFRGR